MLEAVHDKHEVEEHEKGIVGGMGRAVFVNTETGRAKCKGGVGSGTVGFWGGRH